MIAKLIFGSIFYIFVNWNLFKTPPFERRYVLLKTIWSIWSDYINRFFFKSCIEYSIYHNHFDLFYLFNFNVVRVYILMRVVVRFQEINFFTLIYRGKWADTFSWQSRLDFFKRRNIRVHWKFLAVPQMKNYPKNISIKPKIYSYS